MIELEMENEHLRALILLRDDERGAMFPAAEIEEALRVQEKILEEIESDRLDQERRDHELDIQALKQDIEHLLRQEYQNKWQEAMQAAAASQSNKESSSAPPSSAERDNKYSCN